MSSFLLLSHPAHLCNFDMTPVTWVCTPRLTCLSALEDCDPRGQGVCHSWVFSAPFVVWMNGCCPVLGSGTCLLTIYYTLGPSHSRSAWGPLGPHGYHTCLEDQCYFSFLSDPGWPREQSPVRAWVQVVCWEGLPGGCVRGGRGRQRRRRSPCSGGWRVCHRPHPKQLLDLESWPPPDPNPSSSPSFACSPSSKEQSEEAASSCIPTEMCSTRTQIGGVFPALSLAEIGDFLLNIGRIQGLITGPTSLRLQPFPCPGSEILNRHIPAAQFH